MPSWFIAMPSHTPMVLTCSGVPPAMRMPALTASAICWRWRCPGMTSFWAETTATSGRSSSSSVRPSALSRLRCGARARPRLIASLLSSTFPLAFSCRCEKCEALNLEAVTVAAGARYFSARWRGWPVVRRGGSRELLEGVFGAVRRGFSRCPLAVGRMRPVLALSSHLLSGATLRGPCFRPVTSRERYRFHPRAVVPIGDRRKMGHLPTDSMRLSWVSGTDRGGEWACAHREGCLGLATIT